MMITRRNLLCSSAAVTAAALLPPAQAAAPGGAELNLLFDTFFLERLRNSPERATLLGLDKGPTLPEQAAQPYASGLNPSCAR